MVVAAPIGGIALPKDLAPSIFFAAAHFLLIPAFIYRSCNKARFSALICSCFGYSVERTILFSLRAVVAAQPNAESEGLTDYIQVTLAMSTVYVINDLTKLLRCVLVNSTYSAESHPRTLDTKCFDEIELGHLEKHTPALVYEGKHSGRPRSKCDTNKSPSLDTLVEQSNSSLPDQPRRRYWFRRLDDLTTALFLLCLVVGFWGNASVKEKGNVGRQILRYMATCSSLLMVIIVAVSTAIAHQRLTRINRVATKYLACLCFLLSIPPIYRLAVMHERVEDYHHTSFDNTTNKAMFYIFHVTPDWLTGCIFVFSNIREIFATGLHGDVLFRDTTPEEREKRIRKEQEKAEKKRLKAQKKTQPQMNSLAPPLATPQPNFP